AKIARIQGMDAGWNEGNLTRWKQDKSHPNHHPAASLYALAKTVHYASLNLSGTARIRSIIGLAGNHREIALEEARLLVGAWRQTYPVLARFQRELTDVGTFIKSIAVSEAVQPGQLICSDWSQK
ncbi:MAG: hypothetical protein MUE44_36940, partial [Oscillatoriaceae cyanobacterium Prado104]|nr:hypothetical protein [Oscillatoriaceae cyanobacterium Prado104]